MTERNAGRNGSTRWEKRVEARLGRSLSELVPQLYAEGASQRGLARAIGSSSRTAALLIQRYVDPQAVRTYEEAVAMNPSARDASRLQAREVIDRRTETIKKLYRNNDPKAQRRIEGRRRKRAQEHMEFMQRVLGEDPVSVLRSMQEQGLSAREMARVVSETRGVAINPLRLTKWLTAEGLRERKLVIISGKTLIEGPVDQEGKKVLGLVVGRPTINREKYIQVQFPTHLATIPERKLGDRYTIVYRTAMDDRTRRKVNRIFGNFNQKKQ